ncbi:MAG TPA: hypothetical protein VFH45_04450 [Acidimicrobiales bacterium]|nr:hypothetical protein [Acidimicrobiales bacterium]
MTVADAVGTANLILGLVYTGYGVVTLVDLKQGWRTRGFSHFGAAWVAMAFTCGPHHLEHGLHALTTGAGGPLDLAAVLVGAPAGVVWFMLRVEALAGGPGDRFIEGTPRWVALLPLVSVAYVAALAVESGLLLAGPAHFSPRTTPNILLLGLYGLIGYYLARSQIANRPEVGGWSISGLALALVFPTCGLMHVFFAEYAAVGVYDVEWHGLVIDWLAVPAAIYFVWVVRALYLGRLADWNEGATPLHTQPAEPRPVAT